MNKSTTRLAMALTNRGVNVINISGDLPQVSEYGTRAPADIRGLVVHHTASRQTEPSLGYARKIALDQINRGAPGIQYTLAVDDEGQLFILHDLVVAPWSHGSTRLPGDENAMFMSVVFFGDFWDRENQTGIHPHPSQMFTLRKLVEVCLNIWDWNPAVSILGHRALTATVCPGQKLSLMLRGYRNPEGPPLERIEDRQQALWLLRHYKGAIDGIWGSKSEAALEAFQSFLNPMLSEWDEDTDRELRTALARDLR